MGRRSGLGSQTLTCFTARIKTLNFKLTSSYFPQLGKHKKIGQVKIEQHAAALCKDLENSLLTPQEIPLRGTGELHTLFNFGHPIDWMLTL